MTVFSYAQDIQFTQFYQVGLYQNPAFAGGIHRTRVSTHQRMQWPSLESKYLTSYVSLDGYNKKYNSGFGGYILYDQQGQSSISSTQLAAQYAYELHLTNRIALRMGLQLGWSFQNVDYSVLTFPSQFDETGIVNAAPSFNKSLVNFVDASSGFILYTPEFWLGFTAHHMNTPNLSFLNDVSKLPVKFAYTGGYKIMIKKYATGLAITDNREVSITPTFQYKHQGKSDQFDFGTYFLYHKYIAGFWYRGIPFKVLSKEFHNNESAVFLLGMKFNSINVTYSYDWTVSTLAIARSGGSHELNLTYVFGQPKIKKNPSKRMPCPNFYTH